MIEISDIKGQHRRHQLAAAELGLLSQAEQVELYTELLNSGLLHSLHPHHINTARQMTDNGLIINVGHRFVADWETQ